MGITNARVGTYHNWIYFVRTFYEMSLLNYLEIINTNTTNIESLPCAKYSIFYFTTFIIWQPNRYYKTLYVSYLKKQEKNIFPRLFRINLCRNKTFPESLASVWIRFLSKCAVRQRVSASCLYIGTSITFLQHCSVWP